MKPGIDDTQDDAAAMQLELLRRASPARRASLALDLSASIAALARRGIREREPGLSEEEVGLRFVELHYSRELAETVRADLSRRRR